MSQSPSRMLDRWMSAGMLAPALLLVGVLVLIPSVLAVVGSFYEFGITSQNWVFVGLSNYARAMADPVFWTALKNNIFLIIGSIITQVGLGTLFAALLDRGVRRGNTFYRTIIFMPVIISSIAVAFVWILIFDPNVGPLNAVIKGIGLTPPRLGWLGDPNISLYMLLVIAAWQNVGFQMVLVLAGLQAIPKELYEAAALDGAKGWRAFVHITLPGIRNVLMVGTLICIIGGLKVFDLVFVTTGGGPANATQVIGSYTYLQAFTLGNMGYADALSVILLVVALGFGWLQLTLSRRG
ncbi:carbohydrate ABC transporter permease [Devosia aquimaris]|uniref:carbohydrate ABC transporter permease n=1 Tax=Devosia aquimaris TaxID=2866214 RepID=UPI001CD17EF0|nr:sugar ABC transporter permease [Devosia sp. CJK-A8-3]